jgi:hypothetical protein
MSTWVIPYVDQDITFWNDLAGRFGPHIKEVYFPISSQLIGSGRSPQPDARTITFLRDAPLAKSVLVNPIALPGPIEAVGPPIIAELKRLYELYGVSSVVVTNLALARLIRDQLPIFSITASVLMSIYSPAQALVAKDLVDVIVPDNRLLRDLNGLKRLRASFSGQIRLMVNEACIPGCLYRTQHFFEMGYGDWFPQSLCSQMLAEFPWLRLTGAWILPRHLRFYDGLYDGLKLAGRVTLRDPQRYFDVLGAYIHRADLLPCDIGGGPASVLEQIDIPDDLFEYTLTCNKDCPTCSICKSYYERVSRGDNHVRRTETTTE